MSVERQDYAEAVASYIQRSRRRGAADPVRAHEAVVRELEEALEELSVSEEELRVQNDELQRLLRANDLERQRYVGLFESAPVAYIVSDERGVIREANRAAASLLQVAPAALMGKPLVLYLPAEEKRAFRARLVSLGRFETVRDWEVNLERRSGETVAVSISAAGLADAATDGLEIRWLIRDRTEELRAQEAHSELLAEQAARVASQQSERRAHFLSNAGRTFATARSADEILHMTAALAAPFLGCFALVDRLVDGRIVRAAARHAHDAQRTLFARLMEHVPQAHPESSVSRVIRTGTAEIITRTPRARVVTDDPVETTLDELGTRALMIVPLRGHQRVLGALTIGRVEPMTSDASTLLVAQGFAERAGLALEHALLVRELENSRQAALEANRVKAEFLAVVSHELRTPLTAALGYTELLVDGVPEPLPERAAMFAHGIQASIHHQVAIMDDLLLFARVEAGVEEVRLAAVDVAALMQEIALLIDPEVEDAGVPLVLDPPDGAIELTTDRAKLRQILLNLVVNALRHTRQGEVRLSARVEGTMIRIEVSDTGVGIMPQDLDRLFIRFWRGALPSGGKRGIGLGLTITKHLVQLLGGDVSVKSEPGHGSVFTVRLPIAGGNGAIPPGATGLHDGPGHER